MPICSRPQDAAVRAVHTGRRLIDIRVIAHAQERLAPNERNQLSAGDSERAITVVNNAVQGLVNVGAHGVFLSSRPDWLVYSIAGSRFLPYDIGIPHASNTRTRRLKQ